MNGATAPERSLHRRRAWGAGLGAAVLLHGGLLLLVRRPQASTDPEATHVEVTVFGGSTFRSTFASTKGARAPHADQTKADLADVKPPRRAARDRAGVRLPPRTAAKVGAPPRPTTAAQLAGVGGDEPRLAVFVSLSRLKGTSLAQAVRDLIVHVPGANELLRGAERDLYETFDALLVVTPDPRSPGSTFLAARHHLSDPEMRAALERGAEAAGETLAWSDGGTPPLAARAASGDAIDAGAPLAPDRLVWMGAPGLVIVAPAAYRPWLTGAASDGGVAAALDGPSLREGMDAEDAALGAGSFATVSGDRLPEPWTQRAAAILALEAVRGASGAALAPEPDEVLEVPLALSPAALADLVHALWADAPGASR